MMKIIKTSLMTILVWSLANMNVYAQKNDTGLKMPTLNPKSELSSLRGNHVAIRVPDYAAAIKWYTEKLDFRVIKEWSFGDENLAYLAPANSNDFWIEILGGGKMQPVEIYADLGKSLEKGGYHHLCMNVNDVEKVVAELKRRGVTILGETFVVPAIRRKLGFFQDPWGNIIELAEEVRK